MKSSAKLRVCLLSLTTVFFWGASYPVTKIALSAFSSRQLSLLRCLIAALFLTGVGLACHVRLPKKADLPLFILGGSLGFAGYLLTYSQGLVTLSSATSSLIVALTPIFTALVTSLFWGEKTPPLGWAAILAAFGGVGLLLCNGGFSVSAGLWWTLTSAVVFCVYNLCARRAAAKGYRALDALIYNLWAAVLLLSFFGADAFSRLPKADPKALGAVLFLGLFPSGLSYLCWNRAMALAERTNDVANFMFVTPVFSTLIGFLLLHEVPGLTTIAGGAVILGSLILFGKARTPAENAKAQK